MELLAYGGVLLLAYLVWRWWVGREATRIPSQPRLVVNQDLTPIDPLRIRSEKARKL